MWWLLSLCTGSRVHGLQGLWHRGLVSLWHVGSSQARDGTSVPALPGAFLITRPTKEALYSLILLNLQNPDTSSRLTSGAKFSSEMLDLTLHFYIKKFTINSVDSFSEHSFPVIESSTSFTI